MVRKVLNKVFGRGKDAKPEKNFFNGEYRPFVSRPTTPTEKTLNQINKHRKNQGLGELS